jgi:thiamine biosynthesis protein ThiS
MNAASNQISVNGEPTPIAEGQTVAGLLAQLSLAGDRVAVERNREIVSRTAWDETPLQPGDVLEIVHFVGGG